MAIKHARLDRSAPDIPVRSTPWFMQLMMIFAVVALAGIVYGFWQISRAESVPPSTPEVQRPAEP